MSGSTEHIVSERKTELKTRIQFQFCNEKAPAECCSFFIFHNGKYPNHLIVLHAQGIRKYDLNRFFLRLKRILLTKFLFINHVFKDAFRNYIMYIIKEFLPQNLALKKKIVMNFSYANALYYL